MAVDSFAAQVMSFRSVKIQSFLVFGEASPGKSEIWEKFEGRSYLSVVWRQVHKEHKHELLRQIEIDFDQV